MQKINLQEPQRNRNANANFVNLIRTSTVHRVIFFSYEINGHRKVLTSGNSVDLGPS